MCLGGERLISRGGNILRGKMSEETGGEKEKEEWRNTLMAKGVGFANQECYEYEIDMDKYDGDKVKLIRAQEERAIAMIDAVAEKEFPDVNYYFDLYDALYKRAIVVKGNYPLRQGIVYFMDNRRESFMYVLTDDELARRARRALDQLLLGD